MIIWASNEATANVQVNIPQIDACGYDVFDYSLYLSLCWFALITLEEHITTN